MKKILLTILLLYGIKLSSQTNWSVTNYNCDSLKIEIFSNNEQEINLLLDKEDTQGVFVNYSSKRLVNSTTYTFKGLESGTYKISIFFDEKKKFEDHFPWIYEQYTSSEIQIQCELGFRSRLKADNKISIYPNPANSIININVPAHIEKYSISFFDSRGRLISTGNSINRLSISDLSSGIYFLKFSSQDLFEIIHFVKTN